MPRARANVIQRWRNISQQLEIPPDTFELVGEQLICLKCWTRPTLALNNIRRHQNSQRHLAAVRQKAQRPRPDPNSFAVCTSKQSPYYKELADFLIKGDIAPEKLSMKPCQEFLTKWTGEVTPDPSTIRHTYVDISYDETMEKIRRDVGDNPIWLCVDETTDAAGRYVANAIVIPLRVGQLGNPWLIHCQELPKTNNVTMTQFVRDSLEILWPEGIYRDRLLILVTDAAAYMKLTGRILQDDYPKMIHITCIIHAFHRVALEIRDCYENADKVIADTKAVFLKAPRRVEVFQQFAPNIPLPPEPVITRWCTWLDAAFYYSHHFENVQEAIRHLDPDSQAVRRVQRNFEKPGLEEEFTTIRENFECICEATVRLQSLTLRLQDSLQIVRTVVNTVLRANNIPETVKEKMRAVISVNSGFCKIATIDRDIRENIFPLPNAPLWTLEDIRHVEYVLINSSEVERSFSRYKNTLRDNRRSFTFPNLRKYIIVNCNP